MTLLIKCQATSNLYPKGLIKISQSGPNLTKIKMD